MMTRNFMMVLVALALFFIVWHALAGPLYQLTSQDGMSITVYSEPCALEAVKNLKGRAIWKEPGKTFEGCWGMTKFGLVLFYFSDKTVALIPASAFERVNES